MQALGVGTGSELGAERTGVGDLGEMLHGSSLIACGSFFWPQEFIPHHFGIPLPPDRDLSPLRAAQSHHRVVLMPGLGQMQARQGRSLAGKLLIQDLADEPLD
jgi:hypothetical protein